MIPEPKLKGLYQEVILDHNRKPRNFKTLENPTQYAEGFNPVCGDHYHLYLKVDAQGKIEDVGFQGSGCAISKSSASMMTSLVKEKSIRDAETLREIFLDFMTEKELSDELKKKVGRLSMFEGVREFPIRVKCATLIWQALGNALKDIEPKQK